MVGVSGLVLTAGCDCNGEGLSAVVAADIMLLILCA